MASEVLNGWEQCECLLGWCGPDFEERWRSKEEQLGLNRGQRYQSPKLDVPVPTTGTGQPGAGSFPGTLGKVQRNGVCSWLAP